MEEEHTGTIPATPSTKPACSLPELVEVAEPIKVAPLAAAEVCAQSPGTAVAIALLDTDWIIMSPGAKESPASELASGGGEVETGEEMALRLL